MLKVDIRNRILKPKVGEIITVIGDIYTTVAETIPDENGRCESCAFKDATKVGGNCGDFVSCSKLNRKDNEDANYFRRVLLASQQYDE